MTRVEWGARREIIRYKLIPRAVAYYTGEAAEEEGDEEDDYDDEDDEARHCAPQNSARVTGGAEMRGQLSRTTAEGNMP